ncbi:LytR/AlgR family response regulator transcription factor [Flavobacterium sp. 28YEA47A]|uniref:LytR/AlgR family response regulator transcription factor n=1 Tax=Flavobacterium sp. 28YEA47A TaxID=3156276 RepID=UPI0035141DB2
MKSIFAGCLILFIITNVSIDYLSTLFQNSAFYISESLLFSSYWILFFPLLTLLLKPIQKTEKTTFKLLFISLAIVVHLLLYPALVWVLSKAFYSHTFSYWQTFNFGLSAYFIKTVIIYGFLVTVFTFSNQKNQTLELPQGNKTKSYTNSILISSSNKKSVIAVNDIFHFTANSPYVDICHVSKKYLHPETLKSLEAQLDPAQFIRIHKSHIVNINKILSVQSRHNGDYDITLTNSTVLRMSRNYVKNFKFQFSEQHQLTLK